MATLVSDAPQRSVPSVRSLEGSAVLRVLVAVDGSAASENAVATAASLRLAAGSTMKLLAVLDKDAYANGLWPIAPTILTPPERAPDPTEAIEENLSSALESARTRMRQRRIEVESEVVTGRPSTVIVAEARDFEADLLVIGSRGRGAFETALLGSVSAEIVDHAPCPVLVARRPSVRRVVFADDGSQTARGAEERLANWPIFAASSVEVISVVDVPKPYPIAIEPGIYAGHAREAAALSQESDRHRKIAERTARRLRAAGLSATATVAEGDAAATIVELSREPTADVIVMGTHGWTGLRRLVLGSVARKVLLHSECSVLIVRDDAAGVRSVKWRAAG